MTTAELYDVLTDAIDVLTAERERLEREYGAIDDWQTIGLDTPAAERIRSILLAAASQLQDAIAVGA